ncbi:MAG: hypothetical protein LBU28_00415 [Spirochaetaceae bacterium]|jgi:hypothetical protein|nr:hypothetical protein [Spirochaetaceae bacterium]
MSAVAVFLLSAAAFLFFAAVMYYTLLERLKAERRGAVSPFFSVGDTIISRKGCSGAAGAG